jgi:hypothetical protein
MRHVTVILAGALMGCGVSPVDIETCSDEGVIYVQDADVPTTQAGIDAMLYDMGLELDLPDGTDCAVWTVYTESGVLLGFTSVYVMSRTRSCFLGLC